MILGKVGKVKDESGDSDSRPERYRNDTKVSTSALKESLISGSLGVQMAGNQPQSLILQLATRQHGTNSQPGKGPDWEGSLPLDSLGLGPRDLESSESVGLPGFRPHSTHNPESLLLQTRLFLSPPLPLPLILSLLPSSLPLPSLPLHRHIWALFL